MKNRHIEFLGCDKGAIAVEYALILPVLSLLLVAVADLGMYIHQRMMVQDLSRAAAQYVIHGGNPEDVEENVFTGSFVAQRAASEGRTVTYTAVKECECSDGATVSCSSGTCPAGDYLRSFFTTSVESSFMPIFPYPGLPSTMILRGASHMQYDG